ncbi:MAG: ABC transporter permease subunit [Chloroflexi bacterium]|nr:ABC transporter permease subunit [Chloroflexota bacterium]
MTTEPAPHPGSRQRLSSALAAFGGGIGAVGAKELRGRMRGRRAFVVLTVYLALLSLFAYAVYQLQKQAYEYSQGFGFGGTAALSATVGHGLFSALLVLETLLVLVLAPAFTTGAVSMEREKQTLELLVTTPLGTLAMVVGKLLSALTYVFLLIVASIPLASLVFAFGAVGPEDLLRAYLMLFALAFGMGAVGLFMSALVRRTQVATVLSYLVVLAVTIGSVAVYAFLFASAATSSRFDSGEELLERRPSEALLWLNPFVADLDLVCTTNPSGYDSSCSAIAGITGRPDFGQERFNGGPMGQPPVAVPAPGFAQGAVSCTPDGVCTDVAVPGDQLDAPVVADGQQEIELGYPRDTFWPRSALAYLVLGVLLTVLSAQLVWPTRRLFRLPRRRRTAVPTSDPNPEGTA